MSMLSSRPVSGQTSRKPAAVEAGQRVEEASDDAQLLADLRCGCPRALDDLSRRYRGRIVSLAMRYVRNVSDAEDLAQDVLLKVWRHAGRFEGEPRLWPWIARITANASISHLRARRRRPSEPLWPVDETSGASPGDIGPSDGQLLADDQAVLAQFREHATLALGRIPANYRDAVVLMDLRQCSTREASASLGIPVPTVKSRAIRGRRLLRHALAAFEGGLGLRVGVP
jgi:RNA polymerase sigma-70 factor (ECF subfamily)